MRDLSVYLRPQARHGALLAVAALALWLAGAWLAWHAWQSWTRGQAVSQQVDRLRAAAAAPPLAQPSRMDLERNKRWQALREERAFNWAPLFSAIEHAGNEDIELLGFHPDKAALRVALQGEARDKLAVVEFLERLAHQPGLTNVHLTHQKNNLRGRLATVSFDIQATLSLRSLQHQ
jgi:hypothetical protein